VCLQHVALWCVCMFVCDCVFVSVCAACGNVWRTFWGSDCAACGFGVCVCLCVCVLRMGQFGAGLGE